MASENIAPFCKYCGAEDVVKFGTLKGVQRWWCKACRRKFIDNDTLPKMKTAKEIISVAISNYYSGSSLNAICQNLKQQYGIFWSSSTVHAWIHQFSRIAIEQAANTVIHTGDSWLTKRTAVRIGSKEYWIVDMVDLKTLFILASRLSFDSRIAEVQCLTAAADRAAKTPIEILEPDMDDIGGDRVATEAFENSQAGGDLLDINVDQEYLNTLQKALNTRSSVVRSIKKETNIQTILDGWLIYYNFFHLNESSSPTPAYKAGAGIRFVNWMDIVAVRLQL